MVADSPLGVLDATLAEGSLAPSWHRIYRVRPRVRLLCRACQGLLHAKISKCGLRFFAHDAVNKHCPLTGETLAHRLLKSALAAAVRGCGWHADLEARDADGRWVADVLATSRDGSRKIAWEAQLARQHDDDTLSRTAKYHAVGFEVVWVFDHVTTPDAPYILVETVDRNIGVFRPLMNLDTSYCHDIERCKRYPTVMRPSTCPGHGTWVSAQAPLDQLVAGVCHGNLGWLAVPPLDAPVNGQSSRTPAFAWLQLADVTRAQHIHQAQLQADGIAAARAKKQALQREQEQEELAREQEQQWQLQEELERRQREDLARKAEEQRQRQEQLRKQREELQRKQEDERARKEEEQRLQRQQRRELYRKQKEEQERHTANKAALRKRQRDLTPAVIHTVTSETGVTPWPMEEGDAELAMGVSVVANSTSVAVICPVASRITPEVAERLASITIYVASDHERRTIARQCRPDQRIVVVSDAPTLW